VVAALVAQKGATLDLDAIRAAIGGSLARFKQPRDYMVLDALPRNTMGKVQKNVLRSDYASRG
jgi:malonyl-CoA/methylmalonyl-CoA synthetase